MARGRDGAETPVASGEQLLCLRQAMFRDDDACSDLLVFGYGSLIFNPIISHDKRLIARIHGSHKQFCL